ncbi:MAG: LacI family transcriptional regulator [Blastochloris sp.]|nr:LacI family transcriptional regulator [Blastochloris sp.]
MVTTMDIARLSGVSQPVVSKVLHGGANNVRVGVATRERIIRIAAEQGYRTNLAAKAMRTGRFGAVTLVMSTTRSRSILPMELLDSIMNALAQKDMHLILARFPDEELVNEGFLPRMLSSWMSDGLLINYNAQIPQKMVELIERHKIPSVWLNSKQSHDAIFPDDVQGGRLATEHLIGLGHRRIAFLNYTGWDHSSAEDRYQGYMEAMKAARLEPLLWKTMGLPPRSEVSYSCRKLQEQGCPTAVVGYVDNEPWYVLEACRQLGIRVPEELSILGFNDRELFHHGQEISTMIVPEKEIGEMAVETLIQRIERGPLESASRGIPYRNTLKASTIGNCRD